MEAYEFKENLLRLFRIVPTRNLFEGEDEYTYQYVRFLQGNKSTITIAIDKALQTFNEIENITENKFTIHYNNNEDKQVAEVAVSFDFYEQHELDDEETHKILEDNDNQVEYEIGGEISDFFIVWLFKKMFEKYPLNTETEMTRLLQRVLIRRANYIYTRFENSGGMKISLLDIMRGVVNCHTLKVTKQRGNSINLDEAIDSFSYTYMCNTNIPIKVYSMEDIIGVPIMQQKERNYDFEAPKRKYNSNLIDYYNLAISSDDPFIAFISYYHIIEYYFDQVYREQQINTLRNSITDPRFSNKDDNKLYSIIEKIIKDNRFVRENGSGNEQQSLNYVLNKYISDLDDYKQRLNDEELNFYQNYSVSFSEGDVIIWDKAKEKILKAISNRIYKTRNALIHSKSSKKDVTYHPYSHKTELEKEISLIKTLAEHIIESDSELLG